MKKIILHIVLFFCITQLLHSQEDGVVAFDVPARNSLRFNRFIINPTFSFVRESNRYISVNNKRQWTQFNDNPETYLFSYSGRMNENMGIGIGLYQQNYGILTTYGGVANYAYNVVFNRENNLTFGINAGFYQSTINDGKVVTNFPDPSLSNIESNSLITINPGINYGTGLLDFGVSINNAVLYNLKSSEMVEDNPEQGIQAHAMYTGYMNSKGFFDQSKFSMLVRSEFKQDDTVISGLLMLLVPKGIWAQAGYNTLYGVSGGLGINITSSIAIEYNFEKSIGELSDFGSSHDITLAYRFKNTTNYDYSDDEEEQALISPSNTFKRKKPARKKATTIDAKTKELAEVRKARIEAEAVAREKAKQDAIALAEKQAAEEAELKLAQEQKEAKENAEEEARVKAQKEAELKAKQLAELNAAEEARAKAKAKIAEDAKSKEAARLKELAEAEEKERKRQEALAQAEAEAEAQRVADLAAEQKAIEEAQEKERLEKERQEKEALEQAQAAAKAIAEAEAKAKAVAEAIAKEEAEIAKRASQPKDETTQALANLNTVTKENDSLQQNLLNQLEEKISIKRQDLKDLKEENDLSEQGIYTAPKPFKSLTEENNKLMSIKSQLDSNLESQKKRLAELEELYKERLNNDPNELDEVTLFYKKSIDKLKSNQARALGAKAELDVTLSEIEVAIDFERKRRIKRAAYDDETDRFNKDRTTLTNLLKTTPLASQPLTEADFDFGETRGDIQILKKVPNIESGYYLVIAAHSSVEKRDEFLKKVIASGRRDINFFYDINTSKYYIYYEKFTQINQAEKALQNKVNRPYNGKMSMVKIEN